MVPEVPTPPPQKDMDVRRALVPMLLVIVCLLATALLGVWAFVRGGPQKRLADSGLGTSGAADPRTCPVVLYSREVLDENREYEPQRACFDVGRYAVLSSALAFRPAAIRVSEGYGVVAYPEPGFVGTASLRLRGPATLQPLPRSSGTLRSLVVYLLVSKPPLDTPADDPQPCAAIVSGKCLAEGAHPDLSPPLAADKVDVAAGFQVEAFLEPGMAGRPVVRLNGPLERFAPKTRPWRSARVNRCAVSVQMPGAQDRPDGNLCLQSGGSEKLYRTPIALHVPSSHCSASIYGASGDSPLLLADGPMVRSRERGGLSDAEAYKTVTAVCDKSRTSCVVVSATTDPGAGQQACLPRGWYPAADRALGFVPAYAETPSGLRLDVVAEADGRGNNRSTVPAGRATWQAVVDFKVGDALRVV